MSKKKKELSPIQKKALSVRIAMLKAIEKIGLKSVYVDVLDLLEDRDKLEQRCETLEWLLESDMKSDEAWAEYQKQHPQRDKAGA